MSTTNGNTMATQPATNGRVTTRDLLDKQPASDVMAERYTIGAMLIDPSICSAIVRHLMPEHFYNPIYAMLCGHIYALVGTGESWDMAIFVFSFRD